LEGFNPFLDGLDLTLKILEGERLGSGQRRDYKRERERRAMKLKNTYLFRMSEDIFNRRSG